MSIRKFILSRLPTRVRNLLWNLREDCRRKRSRLDDDLLIEIIMYALPNSPIKRPTIKTADETIAELLGANKSIARFGDGEIVVAQGGGIPFQRADARLAERLNKILTTPQENLLIAINRRYYYPDTFKQLLRQKNPIRREFELYAVPRLRRQLDEYINLDFTYYEAGVSARHFDAYREFFAGKKLVLVGCKEAFSSYKFNVFDTAAQLCYEFVPNKHAFSEYDGILARLMAYDREFVYVLMCGPTANVLAADLCADGRQGLDLGHLAKFYDWHKRGIDYDGDNGQNTAKFNAPDE